MYCSLSHVISTRLMTETIDCQKHPSKSLYLIVAKVQSLTVAGCHFFFLLLRLPFFFPAPENKKVSFPPPSRTQQQQLTLTWKINTKFKCILHFGEKIGVRVEERELVRRFGSRGERKKKHGQIGLKKVARGFYLGSKKAQNT